MSPVIALALATLREMSNVEDLTWNGLAADMRRTEASEARRILKQLRSLGFDVVERRTTKVRRRKAK